MVYRITRWVCNTVKENAEITLDLRAYRERQRRKAGRKKIRKGS